MVIKYGSGPARQNSTPNICITKWDTSIAGGTPTGVKIPFVNQTSNEYRLTIDWGDGTKENLQNRSGIPLQHTYDETGIYTIRMVGTMLGWDNSNYNNTDDAKLIDIVNWGPLTLKNDNSFYGSTNLTYISADDYPNFRFVSSYEGAGTYYMFSNCSNLTGIKNLASWTPGDWDINGSVGGMFNNCTNFNDSGILAWDYTNGLTSMPGITNTAWTHSWSGIDLTQVISSFSTNYFQTYTVEGHLLGSFNSLFSYQTLSNLADMGHVEAFNNLPNLTDVTSANSLFTNSDFSSSGDWVTGLDLSNIETGNYMFVYARNLNLDMSVFNLQKLKSADSMFSNLPSTSQPQVNLNCTGLETTRLMFNRCYYFTGSVDIDTSNVTNMDRTFFRCYKFNHPSITGWNTSNVTNMYSMFETANEFNQDISNWDTSNVINMYSMFDGCFYFNQPIGSWDVGKVQTMKYMLYNIYDYQTNIGSFDQDLGSWRMSGLTSNGGDWLLGIDVPGIFNNGGSPSISGWVFGDATSFVGTFYNQVLFNQPIGPWDTSKITAIGYMLYNCDAFDQDLSNWVVTGITNAYGFMQNANGLSTTNYDRTLSGWSSQSVQNGVNIHFGNSRYSTATGAAYRSALVSAGWTITDGGAV